MNSPKNQPVFQKRVTVLRIATMGKACGTVKTRAEALGLTKGTVLRIATMGKACGTVKTRTEELGLKPTEEKS